MKLTGVEQRTGTTMLTSFFNRKPDVADTMICLVCKKDAITAKGQLNSTQPKFSHSRLTERTPWQTCAEQTADMYTNVQLFLSSSTYFSTGLHDSSLEPGP